MAVENRVEVNLNQSVQGRQTTAHENPVTLDEVNGALQNLERDEFTGFVRDPKRRDELGGLRYSLMKSRDRTVI